MGCQWPDTYFAGNDTASLREFFLRNVCIEGIIHYTERDKVFENVSQAVAVSVMVKGARPRPFRILTGGEADIIDPATLRRDTGYLFKGINAVVAKMRAQPLTFGDVCDGYKGDVNLGIKKGFFRDKPATSRLPLIRGIQIAGYAFLGSAEWCEKAAETRGHTGMERVVFQEVANAGLIRRVKGTLMKDVILGDSTNYVYSKMPTITNRLVLAVLNSQAVNYYFKYFNQTNHVPIGELKKIPFPGGIAEHRAEVEALVDRILAAKRGDPEADTVALEAAIDALVYRLYNLTPEEIAIVKAAGGAARGGGRKAVAQAPSPAPQIAAPREDAAREDTPPVDTPPDEEELD